MTDLVLIAFVAAILAMGFKRPFLWVLLYIYVDIVAPQKIGWGIIQQLQLSLVAFVAAFAGYIALDDKKGSHFTLRQWLIVGLLGWCAITTAMADFPEEAAEKWSWVWKALFFAAFLPLTLRTRLRVEAAALIMVLAAASIIIPAGIKTVFSGGGSYGTLVSLVNENSGLYEGSTLSTVAIATIPLMFWVARHGTVFPRSRWTTLFAVALCFAALLVPIGTQTRTGLVCIAALGLLTLRSVKHRALFVTGGALALLASIPFLPASYTERMATITDHQSDQSASTRVQVWLWTIDYVQQNPLGGGFDAYRSNSFTYDTRAVETVGGVETISYHQVTDEARAYHSAYFEVLGEQGIPGFALWLALQLTGLWHMERIRRRHRDSTDPENLRTRSLATALQHGHLVYLVGALFIGAGYQPFLFMLFGLQIALYAMERRQWDGEPGAPKPWHKRAARHSQGAPA